MPRDDTPSPLSQLALRETPDVAQLLGDVRDAMNQAHLEDLFVRMEHNHNARFNLMEGQNRTCRKQIPPGKTAADVFPWVHAANHEVKLTDEIIIEINDLLMVAAGRAQTSLMPKGLDAQNDERMKMAEEWGQVREDYRDKNDTEIGDALAEWGDTAWEYGHGVVFCGWKEESQADKRTLTADQVIEVLTAAALLSERLRLEEQALQLGEDPAAVEIHPDDQAYIMEWVQTGFEELAADESLKPQLVETLMEVDPLMDPREAKRVARSLRRGEEAVYFVPKVVRSSPDVHALKPGLNVFYPRHTKRIQDAQWILVCDWHSDVKLREMADTGKPDERWDSDIVEEVIKAGATEGNSSLCDLSGFPSWVLSASTVGQDVDTQNMLDGNSGLFRVLTLYYRSSALGGVPALYKTVFSEMVSTGPLHHTCCEHAHAKYPMMSYKAERRAPTLWDSRGVGERSFSEQEEIRIQVNSLSDNASLKIKPPIEVPMNQAGGRNLIRPGAQIPTRRAGDIGGIKKIDLAGDSTDSVGVQRAALERSDRYWLRGPAVDPIAKSNRQERLVSDWLACVRDLERLMFQTIQQYAPDEIIQSADLRVTWDDIQGEFSVRVEFDTGTLDPKTVESRMKMLREYVVALDNEGLLMTEPLLRLMTMMINPSWAKLLVTKSEKAAQEDVKDITSIVGAALNGVEMPYIKGKNHAARADIMRQLMELPALDEQGAPMVDPETQQPMPGRVARILMENADVAALWDKRLKWETFEADQKKNARTGAQGGIQASQAQAA